MKILAIRGKNLASLAGEFTVDFQSAPLAQHGLFAITGPTGAGKSTLLDALCLALYDETPRLAKAASRGVSVPDGSSHSISPNDSRNLLRRGCAEGYAMVDFIGNDGLSYRAMWSIKRANGKTNGKLAASKMALFSLPDERPLGGSTNKEIKLDIVQKIGLNFEQFTRAVLLAQNEFFAFLKADDNERGELLETLTGSSIYSDISKLAHERERQERNALELIKQKLAGKTPLTEEQRVHLQHALVQEEQVVQTLEEQRKQIDLALLWHQQFAQFEAAQREAHIAVQAAEKAWQAAQSQQEYFAQVEQVQSARPLMLECERSTSEMAKQRQQLTQNEKELKRAGDSKLQAEAALAAATEQVQQAQQGINDAAPLLDQAKALDAQIATLTPAHTQLQAQREQAQRAAHTAQQATLQQQQQMQALQLSQAQHAKWLAQHQAQAKLAQDWARWDTLFGQASSLAQQQVNNHANTQQAFQLLLQLQESERAGQQVLRDAAARYETAQLARQQAQATLAEIPAQDIAQQKQLAEKRRESLHSASTVWHELQTQQHQQQQLLGNLKQQQAALKEAEALLERLRSQEGSVQAAYAQAEQALKAAEMACAGNVQQMRAQLQEGQACPVCGSEEHPYFDADPRLQALLSTLQEQTHSCQAKQQQHNQEMANQNALATSARQQTTNLSQQLKQCERSLKQAQATWQQHPIVAEIGYEVFAEQYGFWLEQQSEQLNSQLQLLHAQEQAWHSAREVQEQAQAAFDDAAQFYDQQKTRAAQIKLDVIQQQAQHQAISKEADTLTERIADILTKLDVAFGDDDVENEEANGGAGTWQEAWQLAPNEFHAQAQSRAQEWARVQQALEQGAHKLEIAQQEECALLTAQNTAEQAAQEQEELFAKSLAQLQACQTQRTQLFAGRTVKEVEAQCQKQLAKAQQALSKQQEASQQAELQWHALTQQFSHAQQNLQDLQETLEQAGTQLQRWLEQHNQEQQERHARSEEEPSASWKPLNDQQLRKMLALDAQWLIDERKQLDAVQQTVAQAQTILHERAKQVEQHLAAAPRVNLTGLTTLFGELQEGVPSSAQLQQAMQQVQAARADSQLSVNRNQLALAQDAQCQQESAQLLEEINAQTTQHQVWAQLSELIGSADGKKFRNVAQQFTLDVLLGYANLHLQQLARRYRLQRIKESLALMVLDQDMGDEMRSVHSLSGGESFLVSLALALGLASLSSKRVKVESLFIDEGFGSLDADTLRVALDALDGLQAQGRKVGVITHVQEMTERIACKVEVQRVSGGRSVVRVA